MLLEKIKKLCKENEITIHKLERKCCLGNGTIRGCGFAPNNSHFIGKKSGKTKPRKKKAKVKRVHKDKYSKQKK